MGWGRHTAENVKRARFSSLIYEDFETSESIFSETAQSSFRVSFEFHENFGTAVTFYHIPPLAPNQV